MCIRYNAKVDRWERLIRSKGIWVVIAPPKEAPQGDLFPGQTGVFLRDGDKGIETVTGKWGLQPFWAKFPAWGARNAYNARSETIEAKPAFRDAFKKRRVIVPATSFYESAGETGSMRYKRFRPESGEPFLMAALWEPENEKTDGLPTFTLVTTDPNELLAEVHDRMPVIIDAETARDWMAEDAPIDLLRSLMVPAPWDGWVMEDAGFVSKKKRETEGAGGLF